MSGRAGWVLGPPFPPPPTSATVTLETGRMGLVLGVAPKKKKKKKKIEKIPRGGKNGGGFISKPVDKI